MGFRRYPSVLLLLPLASLIIAGCNSNSSSQIQNQTSTYTIGGTVSGLSGGQLVLQANGANSLSVSANGSFTFTTSISSGAAYMVTILTQPSSPAQSCMVRNSSGVAGADVTSVQVTCTSVSTSPTTIATAAGEWTWAGGSDLANIAGAYGQLGSGAVGDAPGARIASVGWTNASGDLWLFGGTVPVGTGCATTHALCWIVSDYFNDLWEFSGGEWAWMGGSNAPDQSGTYGTKGVAASGNIPGARSGAVSWTDASGGFWLFGGEEFDQNNSGQMFNDLWKYDGSQWTWVSGSNAGDQIGVYGTLGQAASGNVPGARSSAVSWTDKSGNLWLFGGVGGDSTSCCAGTLNDLWKFNGGEWTWVSGSNVADERGAYGTQGTASSGNVPGARQGAVGWTDASGNLWLFGGYGLPTSGEAGQFNDLWEFTGGEWIWVSGSSVVRQPGVYGVQGTPAPGNVPGARESAMSWTDAAGDFWLFGGLGYDSAGAMGDLNDLWKYSGGEWTWVSGSKFVSQSGTYGILGTPASSNVPGARDTSQTWIDPSGNLWLFGGNGADSTGTAGQLNDLWVYQPQ
ncbi:MAG: hypothetical protein ACLQG3_09620 [Terracidiphilus sp.]